MCDNSKKFLEKSTLSFGGCGFMGIYHVGVAECVQRYARDLVSPDKIICGTSAGAMIAVSLKIGLPLSEFLFFELFSVSGTYFVAHVLVFMCRL